MEPLKNALKTDRPPIQKAIEKGFSHARIIDINAIKEQCDIECGYIPPKLTGVGSIDIESASIYELGHKSIKAPNKNGSIDIENASMYELESNRRKIDIVDVSKFEFKKGDKIECLFFDYDSYLLRDKSKTELNKLAWFLTKNKSHSIQIKSYTDAKGSHKYNTRLAQNRANTTQTYLIRLGVNPLQISTRICGEKNPIAINETTDGKDSEEGRQYNRRIELTVYDINNQSIDIIKTIFVPKPLRPNNTK
ncbi:MAG: OmpA family protein [Saprospiraceae bacterium]|nr:OmpA family protein [Saprospiraceae bacterium]